MTLAVSLRVPDGVVIAADSLSTSMGQIGMTAEVGGSCPKCKEEIKIKDLKMPPIPIPTSTSSFAQKVFPFHELYGVATYGMAILNEKTVHYHVKELEKQYENRSITKVAEVSKILIEYFDEQIRKQIKDIDQAPDNYHPLGFLVAGFDVDIGKTVLINMGKKPESQEFSKTGCTIGGDVELVLKLWEFAKSDPRRSTRYGAFSLQDAVDYAEYLINTTTNFQRFANMIPTVGGEVDIGLITPFREFTWIKCKKLTNILESMD